MAANRKFSKPEAFDHDGDGKPGGSLPKVERAEPAPPAPSSTTPQYDAAMKARADGTLQRATLTEKGWVTPAEKSD